MNILADIGATKMRIAGSRTPESFDESTIIDTPLVYEEGIAHIADIAKSVAGNDPIERLIAGVPARLSHDKRQLITLTNLPNWNNHDLAGDLEKKLGAKVFLENDTALVGLGEATAGAGKDAEIVVYVTISTGVNGVRVVKGAIDPAAFGFEIGYQYLSIGDVPVRWADMISGKAISEKYGKHPKDLGKDNAIWEDLARTAAFGIHNSILHWSPDTVVIGGSMMNEIGISIDRVKAHLAEIMKAFPSLPNVLHATLGEVGGLWGGLAQLKRVQ